jgi:hypothetical protein
MDPWKNPPFFVNQPQTDQSLQLVVERNLCSKCKNVAIGTSLRGGFLCEDCVRVLIIRKQLWVYPAEFREKIIFFEGLKGR